MELGLVKFGRALRYGDTDTDKTCLTPFRGIDKGEGFICDGVESGYLGKKGGIEREGLR